MGQRQHFIDQQGGVVYWVNDKQSNCDGCCYNKIWRGDVRHCNKHVPAEHLPTVLNGCIGNNKVYKRVK